jgi:hypothetical protein
MAEGVLDLSLLDKKKILLVKVPAAVAAAWRPLCEAAMAPVSEEASNMELSSLRFETEQKVITRLQTLR